MVQEIGTFISAVVAPVLESGAVGVVIAGLMLFTVGWAAFAIIIGRKD